MLWLMGGSTMLIRVNLTLKGVDSLSQFLDISFRGTSLHGYSTELARAICTSAIRTAFDSSLRGCVTANFLPTTLVACARNFAPLLARTVLAIG